MLVFGFLNPTVQHSHFVQVQPAAINTAAISHAIAPLPLTHSIHYPPLWQVGERK